MSCWLTFSFTRCVLCSAMYFNYASLSNHYRNCHNGFNDFYICLRDGHFFDSLEKLEEHVIGHQRVKKRASHNNNELKE